MIYIKKKFLVLKIVNLYIFKKIDVNISFYCFILILLRKLILDKIR